MAKNNKIINLIIIMAYKIITGKFNPHNYIQLIAL